MIKLKDLLEKKHYPVVEPQKGVKIYGSIDGNEAKLGSIEIKSSLQGQGLGKKYVKEFETWAKKNGAKLVKIDAYKKSIPFWKKMGYKLEKDFPVMYGHKQDFKIGAKKL